MDIGRIVGNTEDWESVKSVLAKQNIAGDGLTDLARLGLIIHMEFSYCIASAQYTINLKCYIPSVHSSWTRVVIGEGPAENRHQVVRFVGIEWLLLSLLQVKVLFVRTALETSL